MDILPAIDLISGCVVRLVNGDYGKKTVYSSDPVETAKNFKKLGAKLLHVVDLDGAKSGRGNNFEIIKRVIEESGLKTEVGGGIRTAEIVERYLDTGAYRVILGTIAITDFDFVRKLAKKYGERVAVSADIKDGKVAINGWLRISDRTVFEFCNNLETIGVKTLVCTDISRDGMLVGANLELYKSLTQKFKIDIIASGGISTLKDIEILRRIGVSGAILGKALYTGSLNLSEAIEITKRGEQIRFRNE